MNRKYLLILAILIIMGTQVSHAAKDRVYIIEPVNKAKVKSPVKVCMGVDGLELEPAKKGVNEGKGHHHVLFNSLPVDLSKMIGRDEVHLSDGSSCHLFDLAPGRHVIIDLFSYGDHIPYDPPISDKIMIMVKK